MQVLKPVGPTIYSGQHIKVADHLGSLKGKSVALIDDGVGLYTGHFIKKLAHLLNERHGAQVRYFFKPNPSKLSPPEILDEVVRGYQAAVIGMCA